MRAMKPKKTEAKFLDSAVLRTRQGALATKVSLYGLLATAAFQGVVVWFSGSVSLFADTIHNLADAATALPLLLAFKIAHLQPNRRFTYGYGRAEDLAGLLILLLIFWSGYWAGSVALKQLFYPQPVQYVWAVVVAACVGFAGNEAVALYRIKVGQSIGSAALVADGYHAQIDALSSLAVIAGAMGTKGGFPLADPIVGLLITLLILHIAWHQGKSLVARMLDGVDPAVVEEIRSEALRSPGVEDVTEIRVRWIGHSLHAEVNVAVDPNLTVHQSHEIAKTVLYRLLNGISYLANATIHIDPSTASGERHHWMHHPQSEKRGHPKS